MFYYANGKKLYLEELPVGKYTTGSKVQRFFRDTNGAELGIGNSILVKLKNGELIEPLLVQYDLILKRKMHNDLYLVQVKDPLLTLETANRLHEEDATLYAQPDFIRKINLR